MSDYLSSYRQRLIRNNDALKKLADDVIKEDPEIEVYFHYEDRLHQYVVFFKGELRNNVGFHEVPYRWSGCGYGEFSYSHMGKANCEMPFTVNDVLTTFKPITEICKFELTKVFFKSKKDYLKWYSFYKRYIPNLENNEN